MYRCVDETVPEVSGRICGLFNWDGECIRTLKHMPKQTQGTQPRPHRPDIGIRLKHRDNPHHQHRRYQRLFPQPYAQGDAVGKHVQPEDPEEEGPERVEHFDEKVPPQARIRREVGQLERGEVDGGDECEGGEYDAGE